MKILKPPALKKGDIIGIAAPASPPRSLEKLNKGIRYLEHLGYRVLVGKHVYRKNGYLAGTDKERASDLNALFADKRVKAIFTVRGGYGSHRILPLLDYAAVKRRPKIFVGYSDVTVLQLALVKMTGLVTFLGPMVASEMYNKLDGKTEEHFWNCLTTTKPPVYVTGPISRSSKTFSPGSAHGRLLGGNLSVLTALLGTPYLPSLKGSLLALEEIDEPPYKIDRMLHHLKLARMFKEVNGIILGDFTGCEASGTKKDSLTLNQVFEDTFRSIGRPVLGGFHFGHVRNPITLPLGIRASLDTSTRALKFLEPAVR